ncbi:MAG TPA: peroxiredoxin [Candidatus Limiplasma sp.]|nr:peroxiredoxin [Candidatus Limiplasma sp.]HPS81172.1 peroxiredoxin [Candidatus Limiplasma sp.]
MLSVGQPAPDFTLPDSSGTLHRLSAFRGHPVVVYFYPRDLTPACTREALAYKAAFEAFQTRGVTVLGISKDSPESHLKFQQKYDLPMLLLSDPELSAIKAYGVWQLKTLYGKTAYGVVRTTYVIDEHGSVQSVYEKVKPDLNAAEILRDLDASHAAE